MGRLIYISRSLIGTEADGLASILAVSKERNDLAGITGMLWFGTGTFAQVLEGGPNLIEGTVQRIQRDPRHTEVMVVEDREVSSFLFGRWGMIRADDCDHGIWATAYLIGLCSWQRSAAAAKLHSFLMENS